MNKYELKTYCLNVTPHRETCEIVHAQTAVDAIRTVPLWKGVSYDTYTGTVGP